MPKKITEYLQFAPYFANKSNMGKKEWQDMQEKADRLPEQARDFITDPDIADIIQKTITDFKISSEQAVILSVIVRRVYLRELLLGNLKNDIIKFAAADEELSTRLAQYLTDNVFSKLSPDDIKREVQPAAVATPKQPTEKPKLQPRPQQERPKPPTVFVPKTNVEANKNVVNLKNKQ